MTAPDGGPGTPGGRWGRLLPRSALGMAVLLLFTALGAGFSGAVLFAFYEYRLDQLQDRILTFEQSFRGEVDAAVEIIDAAADDAAQRIAAALEPLEEAEAPEVTYERLRERARGAVWFVTTADVAGAPRVGTAFGVFSSPDGVTFLLTSFSVVRAAAVVPGPPVTVRSADGTETGAAIVSVDESRDLALLSVDRPGQPTLDWADGAPAVADRIFAVSALGAEGASVLEGRVVDVSAAGILHDLPVGGPFLGAPVLNASGEVVAVASTSYAPLGFAPEGVLWAVPVRAACEVVLDCG